jgi:hypothetical protein
MKLLPALALGLALLPLAPAYGADAKAAPALQVSEVMRAPDRLKGPLRVEGVVSKVFAKEQMLGLIDAAEFRKCGVVTCADEVLPVRWKGAMPPVKSLVRVEGQVQKTGEKLEFVARSVEKVGP